MTRNSLGPLGKPIDMRDDWLDSLRLWASGNENVLELWLFGSRVKGTAQPNSDIDIALAFMPPTGNDNWAAEAYAWHFDEWKAELKALLNWEISLAPIGPGFDMDAEVRATGVRLWRRKQCRYLCARYHAHRRVQIQMNLVHYFPTGMHSI